MRSAALIQTATCNNNIIAQKQGKSTLLLRKKKIRENCPHTGEHSFLWNMPINLMLYGR